MAILFGLLTGLLILGIYGLTLPKNVSFNRTIIIQSTPETIYPFLEDLTCFAQWNAWIDRDPTMTLKFTGDPGELDSTFSWKGNRQVGQGMITLQDKVLNKSVTYGLTFGKNTHASCSLHLEPHEESCIVTWAFNNEIGFNPFLRAMGHVFKKIIAKDYEVGLQKLKLMVEVSNSNKE